MEKIIRTCFELCDELDRALEQTEKTATRMQELAPELDALDDGQPGFALAMAILRDKLKTSVCKETVQFVRMMLAEEAARNPTGTGSA